MAQNEQTIDGQAPVDDKIDNAPDPTAGEAERAMTTLEQAAAAANAADGQGQDKPADKNSDGIEFREDPRNAIYANARKGRDTPVAVEQQEEIDPNSAAAIYGSDAVTSQPAAVAAPQTQPDDMNRTVKVKINGVEQEVPIATVVSNYQKVQAGDVYLRQAKETADQIINSARTIATQPGASIQADNAGHQEPSAASTETQGQQPPTPAGAKVDREKLARTVEAISLGSTEEGVNALADLLIAAQPQPLDIDRQVRTALASKEIEDQSLGATQAFATKYPAIASDDILKSVTGELMKDEMIKDFVAAGVPKEAITKLAPDRATLKVYHDRARMTDKNFGRPLSAIFAEVEKAPHFVKLAGDAKPVLDINVDRGARKVVLPQQPAHRSPPSPPNGQAASQPASRQQNLSRGFDQIRAGRVHQSGA